MKKKILTGIAWIAASLGTLSAQSQNDLQGLISKAKPGDTIRVRGGQHTGNLVVAKRLFLLGEGGPLVRGNGVGSVITILADSCVVRGFLIEHSGKMLVDEDAGILIKSNGNVIENNRLRDVLFGIYFFGAGHNLVARNEIVGRKELDLGERGSGIHLWNSNDNTLRGNVITDVRDGFYIQNANRTLIEANEVFAVRYGLHYMYADSNVFLRNKFVDNVAGAAVMYSRGIRIRHNVFQRNRGFSSYGILFQDCQGMLVDSNIVADNNVGLFFEATRNNVFRHNVIARNDAALQMFQNSTENAFIENAFIENLSPLLVVGKQTMSRWSVGGRGNYWSGYDGYDMDQDGIGDIPMKIQNIFQYLEGRTPNLKLYLYSPAAQALAVSAKAFPVMEFTSEVDAYPLVSPIDLSASPAMVLAGLKLGGQEHAERSPVRFVLWPGGAVVCGLGLVILARRKQR